MKNKFLSLLAASALAVGSLTPVKATEGVVEGHRALWQAIREVGVITLINNPQICRDDISGAYDSSRGILVICQENARGVNQVEWTAYDLDTLRHEAHHLIQDCAVGRIGDSQMARMFEDYDEHRNFIKNTLTASEVRQIIKAYRENGATNKDILIELEAFAVADSISAEQIANKVLDWCGDL